MKLELLAQRTVLFTAARLEILDPLVGASVGERDRHTTGQRRERVDLLGVEHVPAGSITEHQYTLEAAAGHQRQQQRQTLLGHPGGRGAVGLAQIEDRSRPARLQPWAQRVQHRRGWWNRFTDRNESRVADGVHRCGMQTDLAEEGFA